MTTRESFSGHHRPWWLRMGGRLLDPWIRIRREPLEPARLLQTDTAVCYVLERESFSCIHILERACRDAGLPSPLQNLPGTRQRSVFALAHRDGSLFGRTRYPSPGKQLAGLVRLLEPDSQRDICIVPVSIYVGRAPARESSWFRVLFSENWIVVGRFWRLLALLFNGRDTMVHFSTPVSMRAVLNEEGKVAPRRFARKIVRVLRTHFRRIRETVIGPDLSHRRTVVNAVLDAASVRAAIAGAAKKEKISLTSARQQARKMMLEIAADYSHPVVRSFSLLLSNVLNKLYEGITMHHFDKVRAASTGYEVIYVPSHRSHVDYLLLSYQLYTAGVVVPHIAAGVNLNLPLIGSILRRGGAFFLRRTFRGDPLYPVIFNEYVAQLIDRGVPMEYFIEGTRSRTGRLLPVYTGMLTMTVRAFLRAPRRPVLFQPVYIGYEKLVEGKSYIGELSGNPKRKESLSALLQGLRVLRQHYGGVTLNFGEPVELTALLDQVDSQWRRAGETPDVKPPWLGSLIHRLGHQIQININRAANVNPVNLLALTLLSTPRHAMDENDLLAQLDLTMAMLKEQPYSDRMTLTSLEPEAIIAYGEQMRWLRRTAHPMGDVLGVDDKQAVLLSYFRNNVLHLVAVPAWVACCFLNNRRMSRHAIVRLGRIIYPFVQGELFLPWDEDGFVAVLQDTIEFFVRRGLLETSRGGRVLERGSGQEDSAFQLKVIARSLTQAFERYYITIAILVQHGPHAISTTGLEKACILAAQRLSLLTERFAPEFFDKTLFRGFIQKLHEQGVVWTNAQGKLDYRDTLKDVVNDARTILTRDMCHSILKITSHEKKNTVRQAIGATRNQITPDEPDTWSKR